ncbi:SDR family NAD(P)-dependent oxidoreductase [Streptomyces sp. NPDC028722]|uniref:SDR family NAD(P)-dependent oxidoreductase n=1 Tax=Streptomyces sp. NPDC028722 TaxID=3155016 RepID=UPI0033F79181
MRVRDTAVVITGAAGGIGRATALALARKGRAVVLAARREEAPAAATLPAGAAAGVERRARAR